MSLADAVPSAFQRRLAVLVVSILVAFSAAAVPLAEAPEGGLQRSWPTVMVPTPATVVVPTPATVVVIDDEAVAAASGAKPALVIADYRLRERKTGTEAIGAIRQAVGTPVPAIVITGDTAPARIREVKASGFDLLHKPVSAEMLSALVARMTQGTTAKASQSIPRHQPGHLDAGGGARRVLVQTNAEGRAIGVRHGPAAVDVLHEHGGQFGQPFGGDLGIADA